MRRLYSVFSILTLAIISSQAQPVSDFTYKLTNGINVKMEKCWDQIWVQQTYSNLKPGDQTPLSVDIRTLGDLISGSSFKLLRAGKEVKMQGAPSGTYDLKLTFKLSGNPGTLGFVVSNIVIKPQTKTSVSITLYDYQILIEEKPVNLKGLASFDSQINRCKANTIQDIYFGIPTFYPKGLKDKPITPDETTTKTTGKIKPGTYDLLISIGLSGQTHKVWLENFTMKPDLSYKIAINLNSGGIMYSGTNKDVKRLQLYPAGTADKQTGPAAPVKNLEIISYDKVNIANCCSPGSYDVLLNIANGTRYEWRKNIAVTTGTKTDIQ